MLACEIENRSERTTTDVLQVMNGDERIKANDEQEETMRILGFEED